MAIGQLAFHREERQTTTNQRVDYTFVPVQLKNFKLEFASISSAIHNMNKLK